MNFSKFSRRNDFDQLNRSLSEMDFIPSRRRYSCRDPFQGDPFKIQSLNFRYADKPNFFPISSRGKRVVSAPQVRKIYFNHDHTIPKCDKQNLSHRHAPQTMSRNIPKSTSTCTLSVAQKAQRAERVTPSVIPTSRRMKNEFSQEPGFNLRRHPLSKASELRRSKTFITQPTLAMSSSIPRSATKTPAVLKLNNLQNINGPVKSRTDANVRHTSSSSITIQINGIQPNQLSINKTDNNIEISLDKSKKLKKSPKSLSAHEVRPSRSYVIHRNVPAPTDISTLSVPQNQPSKTVLIGSSTHSMIPHREEKPASNETNARPSVPDTIRAYSGIRLRSASRNNVKTSVSNRNLQDLEKILMNNPIVVKPKGRVLFTESKSVIGQSSTSSAVLG